MLSLRHLITFVGVYEERSFTKAAKRLNATQSGLSMQTQLLEQRIGILLFERTARGVSPTHAGQRLYVKAVEILRNLDEIDADISGLKSDVGGDLSVGLMPTFTRSVLAPALNTFMSEYPNVRVSVVEAYSGVLTEGVASGTLDFAIVPGAVHRSGLKAQLLGSDREILVRKAGPGPAHLSPVNLTALPPLKLVLPGKGNARRDAFESYASLHGIKIASVLSMDAMIATLEFVAQSDFMTILPETICVNDLEGNIRALHPIANPVLTVDYVIIEIAKKALPKAAVLFLDNIEVHYGKLKELWPH